MKHKLSISVSKQRLSGGVVACRKLSLRDRLLTLLLGPIREVTILVPGNSVNEVCITEQTGGPIHEAV